MPIDFPRLLDAAGGEIVGKVRLQKIVYLLDQMGMNSGFSYDYHHYGPFSAEVADCIDNDIAFGKIREDVQRRVSDGVAYSIFRLGDYGRQGDVQSLLGNISFRDAQSALFLMQRQSATVLELAATIHWLAFVEGAADWRAELVRRKGIKTAAGRTDQALALLSEVGLAPVS